jgi:hypothetical protein
MILNMIALFLLVILKPEVHTLPVLLMHVIIKLDLFLQIGLGIYGLWVSIDNKLFIFFLKLYGMLLIIYILLKIPALDFLNKYYIVVPGMFSPFPFVLAWVINKAFYKTDNGAPNSPNKL